MGKQPQAGDNAFKNLSEDMATKKTPSHHKTSSIMRDLPHTAVFLSILDTALPAQSLRTELPCCYPRSGTWSISTNEQTC